MTTVKSKSSAPPKLSDQGVCSHIKPRGRFGVMLIVSPQEVQSTFSRFQSDLQALAQKIGEIESEADEYE